MPEMNGTELLRGDDVIKDRSHPVNRRYGLKDVLHPVLWSAYPAAVFFILDLGDGCDFPFLNKTVNLILSQYPDFRKRVPVQSSHQRAIVVVGHVNSPLGGFTTVMHKSYQ